MKKTVKRKNHVDEPQVETPDIAVLIDKIQQQLVSLEKKVDTLISQPSARPVERKDFSKPFARFDNSFRRDRGGRDNNFRERSFTKAICADCKAECEVPFKPTGDRPVYCKECFARRKAGGGPAVKVKFERSPGEVALAGDPHFNKPQDKENRRPGGKKKPALRKRK